VLEEEVDHQGKLSYRIDLERYEGAFKQLCREVNLLVDQANNDLFMMFEILEALGDGNFDLKIKELPGEKSAINRRFDAIVGSMRSIHGEINRLLTSAEQGKLNVKADADMFKGVWAELIVNMNRLLAVVAEPLAEIETSLAEMAKGNFKTTVTGSYQGAFDALKQTVNSTGNELIQNVEEISRILQALAEGDLTVAVQRPFIGSYTPIKAAIITIFDFLNKSMRTIQESAGQVRTGAAQMSQNATDLADGASRQAASLEELNASIESINENTKQSAQTAQMANQRSLQSTESAQSGSSDMKSMVEAMNNIKSTSANISNIIGLIENVSFQTNLLALNASVEAARAGEHGRGFSVVAEEVRNLATRSQNATKDTTTEIEASLKMVDEGMIVAQSTAASLEMIVGHVQEVSQLISQIASMSQEQAEAIEHVYMGVNEISRVVQANSATSEESAAASQELASQAEVMQEAVSFFKVRDPRESYPDTHRM
jgi:methyl-accepting chemotaxis protein